MVTQDVIDVLEKLQTLGFIKLGKISNNYYTAHCPFHKDGQERRPSFGVLLRDEYRNRQHYPIGWSNCFTCGWHGTLPEMVSEILKRRSITQTGLEWLTENIPGFSPDQEFESLIPNDLMKATQEKFAVNYIQELTNKSTSYVSEEELASYRFTVDYMYERKLTDEIIEKYDVGYDANFVPYGRSKPVPCITFPVHDRDGNTLFICRRSIQGKMYNYPTGVTKPLYGVDMIPPGTHSVFICESIINSLTLSSWGFQSVALMGTGNPVQMQQLRELGAREYNVCTDGDEAGVRAAKKLKNALSKNALIWVVPMPPGKDINDLTYEEFMNQYSQRE